MLSNKLTHRAFMIFAYLLDEVNVFPGFISESVPVFQQGYDIGT